MNISETSGPIAIKFYMKHHLGKRNASLCFGPDRIRTLVSMSTDDSQSYNGGSLVSTIAPSVLIGSSSFLEVRR